MALYLHKQTFMRKPLHSLVEIRTGHTFRSKIEEDPNGRVRILQIKDLKGRPEIFASELPFLKGSDLKDAALLKPSDIVLPARGEYYKTALLKGEGSVVASSQLFVLGSRIKDVMPEYLGWYLNQSAAQHYFLTHRSGTSIPMLNKQSLGALQIPVPPMEIQRKIVAIQQCWEQEKQLTKQLLTNREQMLKGIFQHLLEQ